MRAEDLFLETMEDLRRRCDLRATEYDMAQVAGLLRRLLLDEKQLWEHANRAFQFKPMCEWSGIETALPTGVFLGRLWLDPTLWEVFFEMTFSETDRRALNQAGVSGRHTGGLRQFLRHPAVRERSLGAEADAAAAHPPLVATVADLIKHFANREGGVHYDPSVSHHPLLERLRAEHDMALRLTLLAAGRILHRAMEPLAVRIALRGREGQYGVGGR